jgi:hypothetical protein
MLYAARALLERNPAATGDDLRVVWNEATEEWTAEQEYQEMLAARDEARGIA